MTMLKILGLTLALLGMIGLAGCETATVKNIVELSSPAQVVCPPTVPRLPLRDSDGVVVLYEQHQEALLIFFIEVERCSTSVWAM